MTKRLVSFLLTVTIAIICIIPVSAEKNDGSVIATDESHPYINGTLDYSQYLSNNSSLIGKGEYFSIEGIDYLSSDKAEIGVGDGLEWKNSEGKVSWNLNVAVSGAYNIEIEYKSLDIFSDTSEISVYIDNKSPFNEASSLFLTSFWKNNGDIRTDKDGNEFAPEIEKIDDWFKIALFDPTGFNNDPFLFVLESGVHTLTIESLSNSFAIKSISFVPVKEKVNYKEYLNENTSSDYDGKPIAIEGEDAIIRSKKSIIPLSDNSGAAIKPQNAFKSLINYIGAKNWNRPGDTVVWEVDVPKSGYYAMNFSYRQNTTINETFYRVLKIDGKIPFEEAKKVSFKYSGSWDSSVFSNDKSEPYKIYLEKGKRTISLSVTMGDLAEVCGELDSLVYELAAFYRSMVMITGENPDANRDYSLFTQIENYDSRLNSYIEKLDDLLETMYKITGNDSGSAPTNLRNMKDVLERMRDNKYYAHQYKSRYYNNYAALSAWVYERSSMPIDIDAIFLTAPENADEGRNAGFFKSIGFSIKRFISSFVAQYETKRDKATDESITLWINWGRDQAKVLKNLINSDFTATKGIDVNVRITNATLLQGILSGNGPDCSIQVSRSEPVNLAMRGGLYDLSEFEDYETVMQRFMNGAGVPYEYNGGHYGIPNTQSFYMLFYRTDIFEQMGLSVPKTWDEFLNISNLFLRQNMQVGLPYTQITDMNQVNTGVGALNIFPTLLTQQGISIYNDDFTASTLAAPDTTEVFVRWTSYYTKFGFPKTYDFYNRFRVGLMPMAVVPYTMYATLTAAAPEISQFWKMAPVPGTVSEDGKVDHSVTGGGTAAVILKESKNPELAWEFIKWWTEAETQYKYASEVENILGTSARHDTANVEALMRLNWDKENLDALIEQWENVKEVPEIPGGYYLSRVIDQAFWNTTNGADPYEMISKWGTIADNEIKRKGEQYGK